ncbi:hypothetical protein PHIN3_369 [Sinorhizobium phage phiN3]|uniref:Uncharacterized protein n=1 Tax=Sinorhizobium phage phiN3 TaxID=1647405 RepID=A0A0F6WD01_9CAUD|nr:hypothetical protein AVT40_gp164 [Sinorhizobium phage phiN3]AKF13632.1 hypothetical protein PHIN3_369 [Sinorhizobium phage phiN3]
MIAFVEMLVPMAKQAGMKVPPDPQNFDKNDYPHFFIYQYLQLGTAMPHTDSHWTNAVVIAKIPEERIKGITFPELEAAGFEHGRPIP